MTVLRRVLLALLLTGLLAAWVVPASAEETTPPPPSETGSEQPGLNAEEPDTNDETPEVDNPDGGDLDEENPASEAPGGEVPGAEVPDVTVEGAELRWGLNDESNNRAFAPGTFNFLSAGRVGDPGTGGQTLTAASQGSTWSNGRPGGWSASAGNVTVEKWNGTAYTGASWAGLSTDSAGVTIPSAASGRFSGHQLVFGDGTGTIDPSAGTATIAWDGDATVVYYSGMTFFYLSDPVLTIADGRGTLSAELSGFTSSMEDLTRWGPVAPQRVAVATFSQATLPVDGVLTMTPDYLGVDSGRAEQVRSGEAWGSFPRDFIDFQVEAGAAAYWFSSGGSADRFKKALPVTVLTSADAAPPAPPVPAASSSTLPTNTAMAPPRISAPPGPAAPVVAPVTAARTETAAYQSAGDHGWMLGQTPVSDQLVWWLLAVALMTMAASTVAASALYVRRLRPTA